MRRTSLLLCCGLAQTWMRLMLNSWLPGWLDGGKPKNSNTYVDRIGFVARP